MSRPPYDMTRLQSVDGGADHYGTDRVVPRVVQWHRPEAQHTSCPFPHPPHTGRPLYPPTFTGSLYTLTALQPWTGMVIGSPHTHHGDAGRCTREGNGTVGLLSGAPWSRVRTYRRQAAPSSSGHTISPHAGRRSLCISALLPLAHNQGSCQAPSLLLRSYHPGSSRICIHLHDGRFANDGSHTRRLHAHAAHRVPTSRADRPQCRPHTGTRGPLVLIHQHSRVTMLDSHPADRASYSSSELCPPCVHMTLPKRVECCSSGYHHADPRGWTRGGPRADTRGRTPPPQHCTCFLGDIRMSTPPLRSRVDKAHNRMQYR
jgi:hypothetical protein